jgi:hypothetical protein
VSTITIASFTIRVGDSDFYDKLNSSLQSTKRDCFTLHENPSLIDLLPGFITQRLKRKENSLKTIYLFFWITHHHKGCCHLSKLSLFRNFDLIPFRLFSTIKVFNLSLRIDSPIFNYCFYGTFLHFSLQVLFCHQQNRRRSHLNICYYYQDLY